MPETKTPQLPEHLASLLTEQWEALAQREWRHFFEPRQEKAWDGRVVKTLPSLFEEFVIAEARRQIDATLGPLIAERLRKVAWGEVADVATRALLDREAERVLQHLSRGLVQTITVELQGEIQKQISEQHTDWLTAWSRRSDDDSRAGRQNNPPAALAPPSCVLGAAPCPMPRRPGERRSGPRNAAEEQMPKIGVWLLEN